MRAEELENKAVSAVDAAIGIRDTAMGLAGLIAGNGGNVLKGESAALIADVLFGISRDAQRIVSLLGEEADTPQQ